jgi:ADP-heptose:LPS heptosyltransferase
LKSIKRFLIIRCGALGDLVYATSIIDALLNEYGDDTLIDFVCTPGSATLFKNDNRINNIFSLKHKKTPIFLSTDKKKIINSSKQHQYDLLINYEHGKQFKSLVTSIKAKEKIGAFTENSNEPQDIKHMVDRTRYLFKNIVSKAVFEKSFPKIIGKPIREVAVKYNLSDNYIVISPSNSHQKRNILNYRAWQNDSWKKLIEKLNSKIQIVIVGNKNEDEFFDKIKPYPYGVVDLVAKTSLSDLIGIIDGAKALISTDTGTAHIASAVNTEVFALIGPTPADETGPYKSPTNKVHIISANLPCSPCYKTKVMKNCKDNICMKQISVKQVYNSIKSANLL